MNLNDDVVIAACGSGRSTSFIPAVPAAWFVTTIAFMSIITLVICVFAGNVASICRRDRSAYRRSHHLASGLARNEMMSARSWASGTE